MTPLSGYKRPVTGSEYMSNINYNQDKDMQKQDLLQDLKQVRHHLSEVRMWCLKHGMDIEVCNELNITEYIIGCMEDNIAEDKDLQ